jgi:hypothetical protein
MANKFHTVGPNIFGSSVWNLLHVTLMAAGIFDVAAKFLENLWTTDLNPSQDRAHTSERKSITSASGHPRSLIPRNV